MSDTLTLFIGIAIIAVVIGVAVLNYFLGRVSRRGPRSARDRAEATAHADRERAEGIARPNPGRGLGL